MITERRTISTGYSLGMLALSAAIAFMIGYTASIVTAGSLVSWYGGLAKPPLTPPNWVFPLVWNALYALMALSAWRVWRAAEGLARSGGALSLYAAQLSMNLGWAVIFFGLHAPGYAFLVLLMLIALVVLTIVQFRRRDRLAATLLLPYLAWLGFAAYLNLGIWYLNI